MNQFRSRYRNTEYISGTGTHSAFSVRAFFFCFLFLDKLGLSYTLFNALKRQS